MVQVFSSISTVVAAKLGRFSLMSLKESDSDKIEETESLLDKKVAADNQPASFLWVVVDFFVCFLSLQFSYLIWGMMQELIMNTTFNSTPMTPSGKFPSATFCVFSNRFLAIIISGAACLMYHGTLTGPAPLLSFTPCALSNTISSWSQYQALSFVSFSLQTIFKSTKIIPVMLMGTMLKGTKYSSAEYAEALSITVGVTIFSLSKSNWSSATTPAYEVLGFLLLCGYVIADSFTSQWQSKLYKDYGKVDHFQMMYGVNVSSIIITSIALLVSGEVFTVIEFLRYNPLALYYNIVTAITSTTGQFAIYYTIKKFGPIVFTVMMTTRQMLSIVTSNYMFGHTMTWQGYLGSFIVFTVIGLSTYRQYKLSLAKNSVESGCGRVRSGTSSSVGGSTSSGIEIRDSKV